MRNENGQSVVAGVGLAFQKLVGLGSFCFSKAPKVCFIRIIEA